VDSGKASREKIFELFEAKKYNELLECCEVLLKKDPRDQEALQFKEYAKTELGIKDDN